MQNKIALRFYNISFIILLITCAALPLIFLPVTIGSFASIKYTLLYAGTLLSITAWIIRELEALQKLFPNLKGIPEEINRARTITTPSVLTPSAETTAENNNQ